VRTDLTPTLVHWSWPIYLSHKPLQVLQGSDSNPAPSANHASLFAAQPPCRCFKEATRIFPPVAGIVKDLQEPTDIDGVVVDAGTMVVASIYGIHHNPAVWPDPEKFDPYRHDPDSDVKQDPYARCSPPTWGAYTNTPPPPPPSNRSPLAMSSRSLVQKGSPLHRGFCRGRIPPCLDQ
jgi:hypothetical protein